MHRGRKWKELGKEVAELIRERLANLGGQEEDVTSATEAWRIRFSDTVVTYYKKGTLYSTPSKSEDPAVLEIWNYIDEIVGTAYVKLSGEKFLIGLDETGKGELVGHMHLVGVIFPATLFSNLEQIVNVADTKKTHRFDYWDELFKELTSFMEEGLDFIEERIPPWHIDKYNINKLMDVVYQRILSSFFRRTNISECRIVIDDYGIGKTLQRFLNFLKKQGAEVVVSQKADDTYLEAKIASLIAKRNREAIIQAINNQSEFTIDNLKIGSGNGNDKRTLEWLDKWYKNGKPWPWFIRTSYSPVRKVEGLEEEPRKIVPPIKEDLLSKEFKQSFDEGKYDIRALTIICPKCGSVSKAVFLTAGNKENVYVLRCPMCKKEIEDLNFTLKYYCGYIVPDSNIINRGILSRDLKRGKLFEDFTILIPSIVRYECDTKGGKKEFEKIGKFAAIGRVKLKVTGNIDAKKFGNLTSQERDDLIMEVCLKENAILITADNQVKGVSISKNIFTIYAR